MLIDAKLAVSYRARIQSKGLGSTVVLVLGTGPPTGLLLLGPAGGLLGLTPHSDAVFQELQGSSLLPARRADLQQEENR